MILISPALNLGTLPFDVAGNDPPYATHLPAYAAVALYHHKPQDAWRGLEVSQMPVTARRRDRGARRRTFSTSSRGAERNAASMSRCDAAGEVR